MSSDRPGESRRSVLKKVAGGAASSVVIAGVASAGADDAEFVRATPPEERTDPDRVVSDLSTVAADCCCCETEYRCAGTCDKDGSYEQSEERQCCQCGGGYICESWQATNRCCLS